MDKTDQWLTTEETAKELNISPRTLNNARSTGTGIVIDFLKIGSRVFYRKSDVDTYIENHTYIHTSQCKNSRHN
jgi:hypothetical protein